MIIHNPWSTQSIPYSLVDELSRYDQQQMIAHAIQSTHSWIRHNMVKSVTIIPIVIQDLNNDNAPHLWWTWLHPGLQFVYQYVFMNDSQTKCKMKCTMHCYAIISIISFSSLNYTAAASKFGRVGWQLYDDFAHDIRYHGRYYHVVSDKIFNFKHLGWGQGALSVTREIIKLLLLLNLRY
jgi:hypothetical protein